MKSLQFKFKQYVFEIFQRGQDHFELKVLQNGLDISLEVYPNRLYRFEDGEAIIRIYLNQPHLIPNWIINQQAA